ncbi:MAG: FAD binding domain-containing protein, partial [Streptosporangiales bacterium]|nr:FAD binding domain-containing protein [Streptosporangiales bacterium]
MFPADFAYARADSLKSALELLRTSPDAKLLAGGQSLLPMMKLRLAMPETVIDIGGIAEMSAIETAGRRTVIGALATYRQLQRHPRVTAAFPAIADALDVLADQQVRARGTVGGSVAHGDPASDLPAVLLALDATVTIAGPSGTRETALDDFLQGLFTTDLSEDEIITAITVGN